MISSPAERLARDPHPSVAIGMNPAPHGVRAPVRIHAGRHPDILSSQPHPITVPLERSVERRPVDPALGSGSDPLGPLDVERAVAIVGGPICIDIKFHDRKAHLRRIIAQCVVAASIQSPQIDGTHPAAIAAIEHFAPSVVGKAAEDGDRSTSRHGKNDWIFPPRSRALIDVGDGVGVRACGEAGSGQQSSR